MKKKISKSIEKHGVNIILEREDVFISPKDLKKPRRKDKEILPATPAGMTNYRHATDFNLSVEKEHDDVRPVKIPVSIQVYIMDDDFSVPPDTLSINNRMQEISNLKLANWDGSRWQDVDIALRAIFDNPINLIPNGPQYYGYITSKEIDIEGDPPVAVGS